MGIGQRIETRYIKHPELTDCPWLDGDSMDAGTAHIVHSNASHLSAVNLRHIGSVLGGGKVPGILGVNAFADVVDLVKSDSPTDIQKIPFNWPTDSLIVGPFACVARDFSTSPAGYLPSKIRLMGRATQGNGTGTTIFLAAITQGPTPPCSNTSLASVVNIIPAATGQFDFDVTLEIDTPVSMQNRSLYGRTGTPAGTTVTVFSDLYAHVGLVSDIDPGEDNGALWNLCVWEEWAP